MRGHFRGTLAACAASAVLLALASCRADPPRAPVDIVIDDTRVFPESVTSTSAGAVLVGSMKGIVYRAAGLPVDFFTAAFAMARVYGYLAHFIESRINNRIIRPAAKYIGEVPA